MKRRTRTRTQQKQINILHTTTQQRHSRKQVTHAGIWTVVIVAMIAVVGVALHLGIGILLNHVLYSNSRYNLKKIEIDPPGKFAEYQIRQATGLEPGENVWTLNLPRSRMTWKSWPTFRARRWSDIFPTEWSSISTNEFRW